MSTSSLNMREFARKLGLQDISSARIDQNPSTVLIGADLSPLLPALRPPTGMYGTAVPAVAAQVGQVFILSLDPGGLIIKILAANAARAAILALGSAVPGGATLLAASGVFSEDPAAAAPSSRISHFNTAVPLLTGPLHGTLPAFNPGVFGQDAAAASLVLAPSRILLIEATTVNVVMNFSAALQAVPVASGP